MKRESRVLSRNKPLVKWWLKSPAIKSMENAKKLKTDEGVRAVIPWLSLEEAMGSTCQQEKNEERRPWGSC
jgi:hypothetical protein